MTTFLLIRHALNDYVDKAIAGWTPEVHLNDVGRAQAERLAERLAQAPIAALYSSPLERARETAAPLAKRLGLEVRMCEAFGEIRYGEWTGMPLTVPPRAPSATTVVVGSSLQSFDAAAMRCAVSTAVPDGASTFWS